MWRTDDIIQQVCLAGRHAWAQVHLHMRHMHVQVVVCAQAEQTLSMVSTHHMGACQAYCMFMTVGRPDKQMRAAISADALEPLAWQGMAASCPVYIAEPALSHSWEAGTPCEAARRT